MSKKYKLEVNEEQLSIIERAVETYARIGTKQYAIALGNIIEPSDGCKFLGHKALYEIEQFIRKQEWCHLPPNASHGIYQDCISDDFRVAWDLYQVVRYARSWANAEHKPEERNEHFSEYMTVNYDAPMHSSKQPLPTCKEIKNGKTSKR
jgi:hypothetical protein